MLPSNAKLCVCTITTAISMIAIIRGVTESRTAAESEFCCGGVCRGMLQGPSRAEAGGVHGLAAAGGSGENGSERGAAERRGFTDSDAGVPAPRRGSDGERAWEHGSAGPWTEAE